MHFLIAANFILYQQPHNYILQLSIGKFFEDYHIWDSIKEELYAGQTETFTERVLKEDFAVLMVQENIGSYQKVHFFLEEKITTRFANKTVVPLTIFLNYNVR